MKSKNLHVRQSVPWRRWLPAGLWACAMFVASAIPGTSYPEVSFAFADKLVHVLIYGVLGGLLAQAGAATFYWAGSKLWLLATGLATLYGASDELHQVFVPNRSPDVRDLVADMLGAGIGALAALAICRWQATRRAQRV